MKTIGKFLILLFAVSLFAVTRSNAQVYLKAPLTSSANTKKPPQPNKYEVWVPEEWNLIENKRYLYHEGYWSFPPTPKSVYVPGHWEKTPQGYYRIQGYWKNPHY
jgi:WXXGXW repeat (2 copies)